MEKIIEIKMLENKDIEIIKDEKSYICISIDNRKINAEKLFELFKDTLVQEVEIKVTNEYNKDEKVIGFFKELLEEINNSIKEIENK